MSVFLEIHCNCLVGKEQCHWALLRAAWVLFRITALGKIHRLTSKTRKYNTTHWFFFHPCCVSVGLLAEGCDPGDKEKIHWLYKNPQCNDSSWPVSGRDTTRMLEQQSPGQLDIFCQLHPALHRLQFLCLLPDIQAHTPHSSCSWFWLRSCRSTGFQEVVHLGSFISASMNSFILE